MGALRVYRVAISPVLAALSGPFGLGCRFTPTCSEYALEAVKTRGAFHGSILAAHRLCRCHPWGESGYDPVPGAGRREAPPNGAADSKAVSNCGEGALDQKLSC